MAKSNAKSRLNLELKDGITRKEYVKNLVLKKHKSYAYVGKHKFM